MACVGAAYVALKVTDTQIPANFALAYAIKRGLRYFFLPVNVAAAAVIVEFVPVLARIDVSRALPASQKTALAGSNTGKWMLKTMKKYGAGYLIATRVVALGGTALLTLLLNLGFSVDAILDKFGLSGLGETAGTLAGAVSISGVAYPFVAFGAIQALPVLFP